VGRLIESPILGEGKSTDHKGGGIFNKQWLFVLRGKLPEKGRPGINPKGGERYTENTNRKKKKNRCCPCNTVGGSGGTLFFAPTWGGVLQKACIIVMRCTGDQSVAKKLALPRSELCGSGGREQKGRGFN